MSHPRSIGQIEENINGHTFQSTNRREPRCVGAYTNSSNVDGKVCTSLGIATDGWTELLSPLWDRTLSAREHVNNTLALRARWKADHWYQCNLTRYFWDQQECYNGWLSETLCFLLWYRSILSKALCLLLRYPLCRIVFSGDTVFSIHFHAHLRMLHSAIWKRLQYNSTSRCGSWLTYRVPYRIQIVRVHKRARPIKLADSFRKLRDTAPVQLVGSHDFSSGLHEGK